MGVLLLLGLAVPGNWAGIFIVIVGLFLAWLLALSWPVITPGSRALRLVVTIVVPGPGWLGCSGGSDARAAARGLTAM